MRFPKKAAVLLLSVCVACCSGCLPHTELDKKAIVEGIGIDRTGDGFEVSVQYFAMEGAGGTTLVDNTKANVLVASGKGGSVYSALESASAKCGKSFMFGIMKIIVLGQDAELGAALSFAQTYYENNPRLLLAAADGKASDVMNVKFREENVSANHLEALLQNAEEMGLCGRKRLYEVQDEMRQPTGCTALPLLKAADTGTGASDDGKTVELTGGALYVGEKYAGKISLSALSGIQLLCGKMKKTCVQAKIGESNTAVALYNISAKVRADCSGENLRFAVNIRADGRYADSQLGDGESVSLSGEAERQCAAFIAKRAASAVSSVINEYGCDPCGLKYVCASEGYSDWLRISGNYGELLKTAVFDINCDVDIDRFGLIN